MAKKKNKAAARKGGARKKGPQKKAAPQRKAVLQRKTVPEKKTVPQKKARVQGRDLGTATTGAHGGGPQEGISIGEFFDKVSAGMVHAQNALDTQSLAYLTAAAGQPHVIPSVFRLPKVSADISFALEDVKKKGFSMLFLGNSSEATTRHQQSLHFDIVAAPPSPEYRSMPFLRLVVSRAERAPVLAAGPQPPPWNEATIDEVLVFQLFDENFIVAFADPRAVQLTLIYTRTGNQAATGTIRPQGPVGPADPLRGLYEALRQLVGRQLELLR